MPHFHKTSQTNEAILHRLRYEDELRHRRNREYFFYNKPLNLPLTPSSADLRVELEHIQDSCNKSTAIYTINPRPEPHTTAYNQDVDDRSDMISYIYEHWFHNHNVDTDFGNFVAKLICVRPPLEKQVTVEDIVKVHQLWCEHVDLTLPSCATDKSLLGVVVKDRPYNPDHGPIGINSDQNIHFKLRPLFRALILVVDKNKSQRGSERVVHLIRTNLAELSAPITFSSIEPNIDDDFSRGHVTTTLSAAYEFVMALEVREQAAFPGEYRDPSIAEEIMGPGSYMEKAKSLGYSGPDIRGPSSGWVNLNEDEDVLPPVTPLVISQRCRSGLPPPRTPWRRTSTRKLTG